MGDVWVLITTELLARGVDFKGVATVINFDIPLTAESYVHRVGRTGRAGKRGTAVTFFTEDDKYRLAPIVKVVHESGCPVAPYLLELKQPSAKQLRHIARSVPHRLAVSTRKRMRIGDDRLTRQMNKFCKKDGGDGDDDGDDGDDADDAGGGGGGKASSQQKKGGAGAKKKSVRRIPNQSEDFE